MTQQPADDLTAPVHRSAPDLQDDEPLEDRRRTKLLDLSLTQLLGGSLAAATAAALGSRLGVVGTITGAAVLSVISAIAANVYTNSMARAREAVVVVRSRRLADGRVVRVTTEKVAAPGSAPGSAASAAPGAAEAVRSWRRRLDRATTRRLALMAAAVFLVAAAVVTSLQLATGARVTGTDIGTRSSVGRAPTPQGPSRPGSTATETTPTATGTGSPAPSATTSAPEPTPGGPSDPSPSSGSGGPGDTATTPPAPSTPTGPTPAPTAPAAGAEAPAAAPAVPGASATP